MDNKPNIKINKKILTNKYLFPTIWWFLLSFSLISLLIIIRIDKNIFNKILEWDFFNNSWNFNPPPTSDPILFQTYLAMAVFAAIIAATGLIFIQVKIVVQQYIEAKYQIATDIDNNYFIFKNLLFVNIAKNITYIFCFTNALTFILVLIYWLFTTFIEVLYKLKFKILHIKSNDILDRWKNKNSKKSLSIILIVEALYFMIKNLLKISSIGIDFDQILKFFIPASSLALIIAVFIQTLIRSDVKQILSNINNVQKTADNFRIFYQLENKNVLNNYSFVCDLPRIIKKNLKDNILTKEEVLELLEKINKLIMTLEIKKNNNLIKNNEYNYLIYHIFYEIDKEKQIDKIIRNFKIEMTKEAKSISA